MVNKKAVKKTDTKVEQPEVEEQVIKEESVKPSVEVQSYIVPILFKREPGEKDLPVADIFYRKEAHFIELQCHNPKYHSVLEMIVAGDISLFTETGATRTISKSESPLSWITSLYQSREFSGYPFIAGEAQALYEA